MDALLLWCLGGAATTGRALLAIVTLLRGVDVVHALVVGDHVDAVFWWHLAGAPLQVVLESGALLAHGAVLAVAWLVFRATGRAGAVSWRWGLPVGVAVIGGSLVIAGSAWWQPLPGLHVLSSAMEDSGGELPRRAVERGTSKACAGITSPRHSPGKAAQAPRNRPDHIVLVLVESLSADYLARPEVPELRAELAKMTQIRGVRAQVFPTHAGILTTLCSRLPGVAAMDQRTDHQLRPLPCLPRILGQEADVKATFLHGGRSTYTGLDKMMPALGFARLVAFDDVPQTLKTNNPFGRADHDVLAEAIRQLQRADKAKKRALLVITTLDSHFPGYPDPEAAVRFKGRQRFEQGVASAKLALSIFLRAMQSEGLWERTAVVITADHAPPAAYNKGQRFAELPLFLHLPGEETKSFEVFAGQQDVAPTITAALGVDQPTDWLGTDLRANPKPKRPWLPAMIGRKYGQIEAKAPTKAPALRPLGHWQARCAKETPPCVPADCILAATAWWYEPNEDW